MRRSILGLAAGMLLSGSWGAAAWARGIEAFPETSLPLFEFGGRSSVSTGARSGGSRAHRRWRKRRASGRRA